ncbi:MAG: cache domain-containing protein [Candidatus Dependentiae bacterium]
MKILCYIVLLLVAQISTTDMYAAFGESAKRRTNQEGQQENQAPSSQMVDTSADDDEFVLPELSSQEDVDTKEKRKRAIELVQHGINYAMDHSLDESLSAFTHDAKQFRHGELYLFVFGLTGSWRGVCLAHGQEPTIIWQNLIDKRDKYGIPLVQKMISRAEKGGGWVTYQWRNSTKTSYVKMFTKGNQSFLIGSGYYPHSKPDAVVSLVKGAVSYFKDIVYNKNLDPVDAFSTFSFPGGQFVYGDLYLYAIDANGTMVANGERPGLVGVNIFDQGIAAGKLLDRQMLTQLRESNSGLWFRSQHRGTLKLSYAKKVKDRQGKEYIIASGYYPYADRRAAVELVRRGYDSMKRQGKSVTVREINETRTDSFRFGDLYLFIYDMNGVSIANGDRPDFVGLNQSNAQDEDGRFYVREIIEKAKNGGGWINFRMNNAVQVAYVEQVDIGSGRYVIGTALFPVSKQETARLMLRGARGYLERMPEPIAIREFSNPKSRFIRGDLFIFVIDSTGICWVYGDTPHIIWRNLLNAKDDTGKQYVRLMINTARGGPGQVTYTINGTKRTVFVEPLQKGENNFILGCGYYI